MQYKDLFVPSKLFPASMSYDWAAHAQRIEDAIERAGGRGAIARAMRLAGASGDAIDRARRSFNIVVVKSLPDEANDWRSTPANTSNVDIRIVHILPNVAWKSVRGWTGGADSAADTLYIDGLVERRRSPEEQATMDAIAAKQHQEAIAERASSSSFDDDDESWLATRASL